MYVFRLELKVAGVLHILICTGVSFLSLGAATSKLLATIYLGYDVIA